jgi:hypothetical protein
VVAEPSGRLDHFDNLGNVIIASTVITMILMFMIGKLLKSITPQQQL